MMKRHAVVIAYDISCNKRRRKVFKCLQSWQLDSQYSLFECQLSKKEAEELFLQLTELIDVEEDALLLSWLDKRRKPHAITQGSRIGFLIPAYYAG